MTEEVHSEHLTPSYEDYIEAIYDLCKRGGGSCRSVDIAEELGFSKASVARATKNLREGGYIDMERYGLIRLTEKGEEYGKRILARHKTLSSFLTDILGVDPEIADEEACKIEHTISEETMVRWTAWLDTCKVCSQRDKVFDVDIAKLAAAAALDAAEKGE